MLAMMYKPPPQHPLTVPNHIKHRLHSHIKLIPKKQAVRKEINFAQRDDLYSVCGWAHVYKPCLNSS